MKNILILVIIGFSSCVKIYTKNDNLGCFKKNDYNKINLTKQDGNKVIVYPFLVKDTCCCGVYEYGNKERNKGITKRNCFLMVGNGEIINSKDCNDSIMKVFEEKNGGFFSLDEMKQIRTRIKAGVVNYNLILHRAHQ